SAHVKPCESRAVEIPVARTSPADVEHRFGQYHDGQDMAKNAPMQTVRASPAQHTAPPPYHGGREMNEDAERQEDLEREQQREATGEWLRQCGAVLPGQRNAGSVQRQEYPGHNRRGAVADGVLYRTHGFLRQVLA